MAFKISGLPHKDVLAHVVDKKPQNYFDEEIEIYFDGALPGGGVTKGYVDDGDADTLASAKEYTDEKLAEVDGVKLYNELGQNEDGAVTQKVVTDKVNELANSVQTNNTAINSIKNDLEKEVQLDTSIFFNASTVTLTKYLGSLGSDGTNELEMAMPVASETQAGVMNSATYKTVQENSELIQSILQSAVSITGLPEEPTQDELTTAWKGATSETELINRASIFDVSNNKIWYYYANVAEWQATKSDGGSISIEKATNTSLGIVKGSEEDGQISVETDGSMSVNGWDELNTKLDNAATRVTNLPTQVVYNTSLPEYKEGEVDLTLIVKDLHTGGDASLPLNIMGATTTTAGVMTAAQVQELSGVVSSLTDLTATVEGKQDTLISGSNIKTINGKTILGEGDLEINIPEIDLTNYYTKQETDDTFVKKSDVENFATKEEVAEKQDKLVSGTNIKTVNGNSLLGEGNVDVEPTTITEEEFNNLWENS